MPPQNQQITDTSAARLSEGIYRVRAVVRNTGYLPTNLTDVAIAEGFARSVKAELSGATVQGAATHDLGHLAGRNERKSTWSPWGNPWNRTAKPVEWTVSAAAGTTVEIVARSEKGGTVRQKVTLPS